MKHCKSEQVFFQLKVTQLVSDRVYPGPRDSETSPTTCNVNRIDSRGIN